MRNVGKVFKDFFRFRQVEKISFEFLSFVLPVVFDLLLPIFIRKDALQAILGILTFKFFLYSALMTKADQLLFIKMTNLYLKLGLIGVLVLKNKHIPDLLILTCSDHEANSVRTQSYSHKNQFTYFGRAACTPSAFE